MGKDTWLKLHTSILLSAKLAKLPDNDHRWAFVVLLLLAKKGLERCPERLRCGFFFVGQKRAKTIMKNLQKAGLLDDNGSVNGFEDSQLTPEAIRKRRQRQRDIERDMSRDNNRDCHRDSRKQKAEKKEPPISPKGERNKKRKRKAVGDYPVAVVALAEVVVHEVNLKFGLSRSPTVPLCHAISLCLAEGWGDTEILQVARHRLTEDWFHPRKYGAESLIRLKAFESALERAKEGSVSDGVFRY